MAVLHKKSAFVHCMEFVMAVVVEAPNHTTQLVENAL